MDLEGGRQNHFAVQNGSLGNELVRRNIGEDDRDKGVGRGTTFKKKRGEGEAFRGKPRETSGETKKPLRGKNGVIICQWKNKKSNTK